MKPPRRPRREKPRLTIRYLQRQIANMEQVIYGLRRAIEEKDAGIANYDRELLAAINQESKLRIRCAEQAAELGAEQMENRHRANRGYFLEGYYAAHQEALTGKTHRGAGAGDTPTFSYGRPIAAAAWTADSAPGDDRSFSGQVRSQQADNHAPPDRGPVADLEIGGAHDATPVQRERHSRPRRGPNYPI